MGDTAASLHTAVPTGGGGGGTLDQFKSKVPQSGQVFIFTGGVGGGFSGLIQIQSPSLSDNFHFWRRGCTLNITFLKYLSRGIQGILTTNSLACSCIADSTCISHTMCVETNDRSSALISEA